MSDASLRYCIGVIQIPLHRADSFPIKFSEAQSPMGFTHVVTTKIVRATNISFPTMLLLPSNIFHCLSLNQQHYA